MWAVLDTDNKTVIACAPPTLTYEEAVKEANGRILIEMTVENSPAWVGAIYENEKFVDKEINNG
jgi:hypothetical protein